MYYILYNAKHKEKSIMFDIIDKLLNLLFPPTCIGCGKRNVYLCFKCVENIKVSEAKLEKNIYPIFSYKDKVIKKALWNLKYKGHMSIAKPLALLIHDRILEELSDLEIMDDFKNPILVPIPLSKRRLRERGFNQSEEIAKEIYKIDDGNTFEFAPNALLKIKETESQVKIKDRVERLKNLNGCFAVKNSEKVRGRNIILIDDITTTGTTINEAKETLLRADVKKVIAFTVAH